MPHATYVLCEQLSNNISAHVCKQTWAGMRTGPRSRGWGGAGAGGGGRGRGKGNEQHLNKPI